MVAKSPAATRAYVSATAAVARAIPNGHVKDLIEWAVIGQETRWPALTFKPRPVILGERTQILITPHLGEFDQAALFSRQILAEDRPAFRWFEQNAADRYDAIIDIGANVGSYSLFFDRISRTRPPSRLRRVYAFEPSTVVFHRLLENLQANRASSVNAFCVAISDSSGFVDFFQPEGHLTNGSLSPEFAALFSAPTETSMAPAISAEALAPLFQRHARILLKIDTEGYEAPILRALAPLIARHKPDLLIEVLADQDEKIAAVPCLDGYRLYQFDEHGPCEHPRLRANPQCRDWLLTSSLQCPSPAKDFADEAAG